MPAQRNDNPSPAVSGRVRFIGSLLLPASLFPLLALVTYDWRDVVWLQSPPNLPPANAIGIVGAWGAFLAYMLLGLGAWLIPLWLIVFGVLIMRGRMARLRARLGWCLLATVAVCAMLQLGGGLFDDILCGLNLMPTAGGAVGYNLMTRLLVRYLSPVGASLIVLGVLTAACVLAIGPHAVLDGARGLFDRFVEWRRGRMDESRRLADEQRRLERRLAAERKRAEQEARRQEKQLSRERREAARAALVRGRLDDAADGDEDARPAAGEAFEARDRPFQHEEDRKSVPAKPPASRPAVEPAPGASAAEEAAPPAAPATKPAAPEEPAYRLPGIDLLDPTPEGEAVHGDVEATSRRIAETLSQFSIPVEVTHVERGPVVTSYQVLPAPGIKVEKIAGMAKNLEMALKATSVRVEAPIPGKGVVGIEVPNERARAVTLREILEGPRWTEVQDRMEIPLALGKDAAGRDLVIDLASIPHLLIAGATGSGKSVCINALLNGLLLTRTPAQVRLLLVDPKIVELAVYHDLPHLVAPVITEPKKVALGLRWAIQEMERRYRQLHAAGVRDIASFNRRGATAQPDMFETAAGPSAGPAGLPQRLPHVVIVIDELADLMSQVGQEIEHSVGRLAHLARGVGIHLVLATQRPSVNVITGTIKANFPGRIAFQVTQRVDSRTILDVIGAETLIGRGDLLFLNPRTSKLIRAQGAYVSDAEIKRVTDAIRSQARPAYLQEVQERLAHADEEESQAEEGGRPAAAAASAEEEAGESEEGLLQQAIEIIRETRRATTSSLQRRMRIGYTRAGRLMDMLEERGIVGPPRGSDPREILVDLDGGIPENRGSGLEQEAVAEDGPDEEADGEGPAARHAR